MPFAEDLSVFFNAAEFATPVTLNGVGVTGIFDNAYAHQDLGMGVATTDPLYTLPSASVPPSVVGMTLVIGSTTYKVVDVMPDGTGITQLRLRS